MRNVGLNSLNKHHPLSLSSICHKRIFAGDGLRYSTIGRITPTKQMPITHAPQSHMRNMFREFGYFSVVLLGLVAVTAAAYEFFSLATPKEQDVIYEQGMMLVKRDARVQDMLGVPIEAYGGVTRTPISDGMQLQFSVAGIYTGICIVHALKLPPLEGQKSKKDAYKLALVELHVGGRKIIVYDERPNKRRSWFQWNSRMF